MSAKEMFEKLGYSGVNYYFTRRLTQNSAEAIDIDKENRKVNKSIITANTEKTCKFYTFEEIQAINKQIEELGWNNGNN